MSHPFRNMLMMIEYRANVNRSLKNLSRCTKGRSIRLINNYANVVSTLSTMCFILFIYFRN